MRCLSTFINTRLDPTSFSAQIEWSLRSSFAFLISGIFSLYFKTYIAVPFLLPVLVLVVSNQTFGKTMSVCQSMYRGTLLICLISTLFYFIPVISNEHWYITLIYFFVMSVFLTVTMYHDSVCRKLALAYHVIFTLNLAAKNETNYSITDIWNTWLLVPMTIIICSIGVLIPYPIFAYQQLIFIEKAAMKRNQNWLKDMIECFECESKIHSNIQLAKLKKYVNNACKDRNVLCSLYPHAKHFELVNDKNEILNEDRINKLYGLHYLLLAMYDTIQYLQYDSFHHKLLMEIKDSLKKFTNYLLQSLNTIHVHTNNNSIKEMKVELIKNNAKLLKSYQIAREKIIFNGNYNNEYVKSINVIYSFFYFLQSFTEKVMEYCELYSKYELQKKTHNNKCNLFCYLSLYDILYPFPFTSWTDCKDKMSTLLNWKSSIFIQSLSISIAMTLCGLLFLYPPLNDEYQLGYWAALTVAFVSDNNVGGTFHTSILRLEGTFLGVTCGFIILQLQINYNMSEIYGILLLTLWMCCCGYYRSSVSRGYSGLVAAFTAALIVSGYDIGNDDIKIEYYAIRRIEMTFIGIASILVLLEMVSPNNARKLLNKDVIKSLLLMREMFNDIFERYKIMITDSDSKNDNIDIETEEESKNDTDDVTSDLISNSTNIVNEKRESPMELNKKYQKSKLKVTELLASEKILITASVFEPMLWKQPFNDELYLQLNNIQFWMLRRISQIDLCLRSLLLYIEKQNESQWLLNKDLVYDITPFSNYLKLFEKYHLAIMMSIEYFIKDMENNDDLIEEEGKVKYMENKFNNYEDVMLELETINENMWIEFIDMINKYVTNNSMKNLKQHDHINHQVLSVNGALVINALKFAVKNLIRSLSDFAKCKISD